MRVNKRKWYRLPHHIAHWFFCVAAAPAPLEPMGMWCWHGGITSLPPFVSSALLLLFFLATGSPTVAGPLSAPVARPFFRVAAAPAPLEPVGMWCGGSPFWTLSHLDSPPVITVHLPSPGGAHRPSPPQPCRRTLQPTGLGTIGGAPTRKNGSFPGVGVPYWGTIHL
ncbi:hypothetical protein C8F04DRAFT_1234579 [Mycena alexandri]|uniref:Uncharacterized protein n=1 Tax=Mycena alexandri TaxID=1745969 RepID=A0AAD6SY81_9AGAR|nr:hypothetical protein C8F04DRAFT_1234579 [Mycena alexandri]